jgi:hypothetical protein
MQRAIPGVLWISLTALGLFSAIQFVIGLARLNIVILISVAFNVAILVGLYRGRRWAFVVALAFGVLGTLVALARNPGFGLGALIGNGLVLVPMLLAKDYFWETPEPVAASRANYCYRCGHDVREVAQPRCPNCGSEIRTADGATLE